MEAVDDQRCQNREEASQHEQKKTKLFYQREVSARKGAERELAAAFEFLRIQRYDNDNMLQQNVTTTR